MQETSEETAGRQTTCSVCGKPLTEGNGATVQAVCQECRERTSQTQQRGKTDPDSLLLESILGEVRKISRSVVYESTSWLNLVGAFLQCMVFLCLVFAFFYRQDDAVTTFLLLGILVQLMALSFFVAGR